MKQLRNKKNPKLLELASKVVPPPIIEEEPGYVPSKASTEMIRKVFKVDLLLCPSSGGQMRIISQLPPP